MVKNIYRSRGQKVLGGVCGGIGEYFNIDPVLVRLIWIGLTILGGLGFIMYLVCWLIVPLEPKTGNTKLSSEDLKVYAETHGREGNKRLGYLMIVIGLAVFLFGIMTKFSRFFLRLPPYTIFALFLIIVGIVLVGRSASK